MCRSMSARQPHPLSLGKTCTCTGRLGFTHLRSHSSEFSDLSCRERCLLFSGTNEANARRSVGKLRLRPMWLVSALGTVCAPTPGPVPSDGLSMGQLGCMGEYATPADADQQAFTTPCSPSFPFDLSWRTFSVPPCHRAPAMAPPRAFFYCCRGRAAARFCRRTTPPP